MEKRRVGRVVHARRLGEKPCVTATGDAEDGGTNGMWPGKCASEWATGDALLRKARWSCRASVYARFLSFGACKACAKGVLVSPAGRYESSVSSFCTVPKPPYAPPIPLPK